VVLAARGHGPPFIALAAAPLALGAVSPVHRGAAGIDLVPTLKATGQLTLAFAVLLAVGLAIRN
jgi:1,4-dihydroxy-2-naphthoate polyprenyltransferase